MRYHRGQQGKKPLRVIRRSADALRRLSHFFQKSWKS